MTELSVNELRQKIRDNRPVCKLCGHTAHSLVAHLRDEHGLSAGQYRKKYPDALLASPIALELLRMVGKEALTTVTPLEALAGKFQDGNAGADKMFADWKAKMSWMAVPDELKEFIPKLNPDFQFTQNSRFILLALSAGKNIYISGPTGCGKTEEVKQVFNRMGLPIRRANMHGDVTYSSFIGSMKANAAGTYFDYGILPKAMLAGYPVLLDEIDFTPPAISSVLFPALERDAELYIPETGEHIRPKKGFTVFATGNTGGKGDLDGSFTGTEVMNSAFLDRFSIKLKAEYMEAKVEQELILKRHPSFPAEFACRIVAFAGEIRQAFATGSIPFTWSTRKVLDFSEFVETMGYEDAINVTILNWLDSVDRPVVLNLLKKVALEQVKPK